jgi:hypothetical protein
VYEDSLTLGKKKVSYVNFSEAELSAIFFVLLGRKQCF